MCKRNTVAWVAGTVFLLAVPSTYAIRAFSPQYGTSYTICHIDLMKPNDSGRVFKDAGPVGVPPTGGKFQTFCPHNKETGDKKGDSR